MMYCRRVVDWPCYDDGTPAKIGDIIYRERWLHNIYFETENPKRLWDKDEILRLDQIRIYDDGEEPMPMTMLEYDEDWVDWDTCGEHPMTEEDLRAKIAECAEHDPEHAEHLTHVLDKMLEPPKLIRQTPEQSENSHATP